MNLLCIKRLLIFQTLFALHLSAQRFYTLNDDQPFIDSLSALIRQTSSDSLRCINLFKLADLYRRNKKQELSDTYLAKANALAPAYHFLADLSIYYNAANYLKQQDLDGYTAQLQRANAQLKKYPFNAAYSFRAFILKNVAVVQQLKDNEEAATRIILNDAIPLAEKSGDDEVLSVIYNTLGIIFMNNGNRRKADLYINKAIQCAERASAPSYQLLETRLHAYIMHAENANQLNDPSGAGQSLTKAFAVLKHYPESNLNGPFYQAQGLYYHGQSQFEAAIASYDLGIKNCALYHDEVMMNNLKFVKAQSLTHLHRYTEARDLLIWLAEHTAQNNEDAKKCYRQIIKNCESIGDVKNALAYSRKYIRLTDSLYAGQVRKDIEEMEAKYNAAEKERKIHQLDTQRQKALLVSEKNKFNYRLAGLLCALLLLLLLFLWRNATTQKTLAAEREKNYQQTMHALKAKKEVELMQATLKGEEEERKRMARDLHDGVGSALSSLKMRLSALELPIGFVNNTDWTMVTTLLDECIQELRQVAYNLLPETILKLGLKQALQDLCYHHHSDALQVVFTATAINEDMAEGDKINIFRIVQELMNNALKHARCTEIILDCSQNDDLFLVTLEDNGQGFDADQLDTASGMGLRNLRHRVALMNGKLQIDSGSQTGTVVNIEVFVRKQS